MQEVKLSPFSMLGAKSLSETLRTARRFAAPGVVRGSAKADSWMLRRRPGGEAIPSPSHFHPAVVYESTELLEGFAKSRTLAGSIRSFPRLAGKLL